MNKLFVAILLLVLFGFGLREYGFCLSKKSTSQNSSVKYEINENILFNLVNDYRARNNLSTFTKSVITCGIATVRLDGIKRELSHDDFFPLVEAQDNWGYERIGENLAKGWQSEDITLSNWITSPTHKYNLDYPYTESCIRCENGYCVQIFAK